jgi:hypothetical protein
MEPPLSDCLSRFPHWNSPGSAVNPQFAAG